MKVLLVSPFPQEGAAPTGGVEAAASVLADEMAQIPEVDVSVLRLSVTGQPDRSWQRGRVNVQQVNSMQRAAALRGYTRARRAVAAEVDRLRPDVVHAQGLGAEAVAVSRLVGIPTCVTPHGDPRRDVLGNRRGTWAAIQASVKQRLAGSSIPRFSAVISISSHRKFQGSQRVVEIPNPVAGLFIDAPLKDDARQGIAVVASVKRIKRIELVIQAAEKLGRSPATVVRIAGDIQDSVYHAELQALAERCKHVEVQWLGQLQSSGLVEIYDGAVALVVASEWEISPLVVVEAMTRRCPVIAVDLPGTRALLGDGERGTLVEPECVDALSVALMSAISVPPAAEALESARSWAVQTFSAQSVASRTVTLYRELISAKRNGGAE